MCRRAPDKALEEPKAALRSLDGGPFRWSKESLALALLTFMQGLKRVQSRVAVQFLD